MRIRRILFEKIQARFFYGWGVVAVATLIMFCSGPGQSHTFSVFVDLIAADLDISKSFIASSYGLATLFAALGLTRMGAFVDRYGPRKVLIVVSILLGIACIIFGAAAGIITLSLGFMVLRFLGQGSMMLGATNLVAQWFSNKRGTAMSIVMLGFGASIAFHPALAQWLIDLVGWRQTWMWFGILTWALMLPFLWLIANDKPESLGLYPDGVSPNKIQDNVIGETQVGLKLNSALKTNAFYIIGTGLFVPAMLVTSLFFFQVSIFEQQGLTSSLATKMFSISALFMALTMPLVGRTLDKTDPKYVFSANLFLLSILLVGITYVTDTTTAIIYAVCFGILNAGNMTLFGFLWANYFGRKHLGSIQGVGQTIGVIGASLGPLPLGVAYDIFGTYNGALYLLAILPVVCGITVLFLVAPDLTSAD